MNDSQVRTRPSLPEDIREIFGELDDLTVARIVGTGATPAEVAEAHAWLHADDYLGKSLRRPQTGKVAMIIDIVQPEIEPPEEPSGD